MFPSRFRPSGTYAKAVTEGSGAREWDMIVRICGTWCVAPGRCRTDDGRYVVLGKPAAKSGTAPRAGTRTGKKKNRERKGKARAGPHGRRRMPVGCPQTSDRQKPITKKGLQLLLQAFGFPGAEGQN